MSSFDPQVEHILSLVPFAVDNDIWQTLTAYHILDYKSFKQLSKKQSLNMTRNVSTTAIKRCIQNIVDISEYIRFHEANGDDDLVADPTKWDRDDDDFFHWKILEKPKSTAVFTPQQKMEDKRWRQARAVDETIKTTEPVVISTEIVPTEEVNSNEIHKEFVSNENVSNENVGSNTSMIHTEIVSKNNVNLNMNRVVAATAADDDDDEIDNAKFQCSTVSVHVPITTSSTTTATVILHLAHL